MEVEHQPVRKSELQDWQPEKLGTAPSAHASTHPLCPPSVPCGLAHGAAGRGQPAQGRAREDTATQRCKMAAWLRLSPLRSG